MARRDFAAALAALGCALLLAAAPHGAAAPMQGGGDTRAIADTPLVVFPAPIKVRPGESGAVVFTLTNRYNQTMDAVRLSAAFEIGGNWLEARRLDTNATDVPAFSAAPPIPFAVASNASQTVSLPFTTTAKTASGVYLISLTLVFQYANATGTRVDARFASLGSLAPSDRAKVDLDNYTATLDALGLDGIVPDSSITVSGGEAMAMWLAAAAFGVLFIAVGFGYGIAAKRRASKRRR